MKPKAMTDDEVESAVRSAIASARDYIEEKIQPRRLKATRYENGEVDLQDSEGRSKYVATVCRDAKRNIKPYLLRLFLASDRPVEFIPRGPDSAELAEQETEYANWKFAQNNGFKVLDSAIDDALTNITGVVKVYYDETENVEIEDFSGIPDDLFNMLAQDDSIEIIEHGTDMGVVQTPQGMMQAPVHYGKLAKRQKDEGIKIVSVPPEEFFIDAAARGLDDFYVVGHATEMRVGDLIEMGFDWDDVYGLDEDSDNEEANERQPDRDDMEQPSDPAMKRVLVTEAYMRMDIEGTGVPRLYSFLCGGTNYKLLRKDLADDVPFADFHVDPIPHTFFGRAFVELLLNDQEGMTSLRRGMYDNVHMVNNPGYIYDERTIDIDALENNEIGRLVANDGPVMGAYAELVTQPMVMGVLPAIQDYAAEIENKTGVSRASAGLNAESLRNATATAVDATVQAREGQAEVIARHLAEGMKRLFRLVLKISKKHVNTEEVIRLRGKYIPVNPANWDTGLDMSVNVGLGTGQRDQKMMVLREVLGWQGQAMQMGMSDPMLMRNTVQDILHHVGIHNIDRYFYAQPAQQQPQPGQEQASDPNAAFLQAEQMKVQQRAQEAAEKGQRDFTKMQLDDDFRRDEMAQKRELEAVKILGQWGQQVNQQAIKAEQAAPRFPQG